MGGIRVLVAGAAIVALVAGSTASTGGTAFAAPTVGFVRVNQVGYEPAATKRAYVLASAPLVGATFRVLDASGAAAFSGPVGASVGSWSTAYPAVHVLDFDAVSAAGNYTVAVSGPIAASSPAFRIGAGVYAGPIANTVRYLQVQRDGPNYVPSALRTAPGHLNDANAMTYLTPKTNSAGRFSGDLTAIGVRVDASGGWFDAGDYQKFLNGANYTAALLLVTARDFAAQTGPAFLAETRFGVDWLRRMWNDASGTLHYQVGIGSGNAKTLGDHDIWRLPQEDDTYGGTDPRFRYIRNRPVFRANTPGGAISPNLAGRQAAAFALCYQVFRTSDPAYANSCLLSAQHVFDLADTNPGTLTTTIPYSFYPESEWRDDLELGATELALALAAAPPPAGLPHPDPAFYLQRAGHWANAYITGPNGAADSLNLYDVSGLAHYELHRAITAAGSPPGLETSPAALLADLGKQLDIAVTRAGGDPFGFGFPWGTWDTTSHGAGLVVMAREHDRLTGTRTYSGHASRWLANILGANAWGTSLIIGDGSVYPNCPHHQIANITGSLDGSAPVLAGAAVEGPNSIVGHGSLTGMRACPAGGADRFGAFNGSGSVFLDNVESYPNIEPAIDLTATSPLAFAWMAGS